jgi:hypothetical protein
MPSAPAQLHCPSSKQNKTEKWFSLPDAYGYIGATDCCPPIFFFPTLVTVWPALLQSSAFRVNSTQLTGRAGTSLRQVLTRPCISPCPVLPVADECPSPPRPQNGTKTPRLPSHPASRRPRSHRPAGRAREDARLLRHFVPLAARPDRQPKMAAARLRRRATAK